MNNEMSDKGSSENEIDRLGLGRSQVVAILLAPLLAGIIYWLILPQGQLISGTLAFTVFTAVLWLTEALPLPVTALLIPVGLSAVGVFDAKHAYTSFGNPVIFLILGGYSLAVAVEVNGLGRWLARHILTMAGNSTFRLLTAFMASSALLSMLISNTATTALLLPVVLGILNRHTVDKNLYKVLLLGIAYGASIGGVATLTGSPPNAIAAGLLGLSFLQWLAYGLPTSLTMLVVAVPILWWTFHPEQKRISVDLGERVLLTARGKRTFIVLGICLLLWLFGSLLAKWAGLPSALFSSAAVAVFAVAMLIVGGCVVWKDLQQGIHWGVLVLLGGGLTLGHGLTESGAADWLAGLFTASVGDIPLFVLLLLVVFIAVFATELISNTAVAAKLAPILMGVELQLGIESGSLVVPVAIATSMAFMLPVATPPNALVYDSGYITQQDMIRLGLRLNLAAIIIISLLHGF